VARSGADREVDGERAARLDQPGSYLLLEAPDLGRALELLDRHAVELVAPFAPWSDLVGVGVEYL